MSKLFQRMFARPALLLCAALSLLAVGTTAGQEPRPRPPLQGGVQQPERRRGPIKGGVQRREEIPDEYSPYKIIKKDCQAAREALDLYRRAASNTELVLSDEWESANDRLYKATASCLECPTASLNIYIELLRRLQLARSDPRARAEAYRQVMSMSGGVAGPRPVALPAYDRAVQSWKQKIQETLADAEVCFKTACTDTLQVMEDPHPTDRLPSNRLPWPPVTGGVDRVGGPPPLPDDVRDPAPREDATPKTPTFWDGFHDGMEECKEGMGATAQLVEQAFKAMQEGDFIKAAKLLGAEQSDAGVRASALMLKTIWEEFTSGRSTPKPGEPIPSDYERGKHGAERLCMYGLIPGASKCVMSGTACAARNVMRACAPALNKVSKLRGVLMSRMRLPRLPRPPTPLMRGMLLEDEKFLEELAATDGKVFIVRDSNPLSMRWVGREGFKPKPLDLKGKTLKLEELMNEGLSKAEAEKYAGLASAKGMSPAARAELLKKGYKIGPPGEQELIRGPEGERFYSDTDLHGVYNLDGTNGWSDDLFKKLQCRFFDRGIQHGPHDNWLLRNNPAEAGPNYGPQVGGGKTLTAIFPDGSKMWVQNLQEMKALYRAIGVNWNTVYPGH